MITQYVISVIQSRSVLKTDYYIGSYFYRLIGPYSSYEEAKESLKKIEAEITNLLSHAKRFYEADRKRAELIQEMVEKVYPGKTQLECNVWNGWEVCYSPKITGVEAALVLGCIRDVTNSETFFGGNNFSWYKATLPDLIDKTNREQGLALLIIEGLLPTFSCRCNGGQCLGRIKNKIRNAEIKELIVAVE